MNTLVSKTFITSQGKLVKIRIDYNNCQFITVIIVNNVMVSENKSFFIGLQNDDIKPHLENQEIISEVNNKMIDLCKFIQQKFENNG